MFEREEFAENQSRTYKIYTRSEMDYKIVLTGHTSPMVKNFIPHSTKEYEVIGVQRESGYDSTKQEDVEKVGVHMVLRCRDPPINPVHVEPTHPTIGYDQ